MKIPFYSKDWSNADILLDFVSTFKSVEIEGKDIRLRIEEEKELGLRTLITLCHIKAGSIIY